MEVVHAAISIVPKIDDPPPRHEQESLKQMECIGAGGVDCCTHCHPIHAELVDICHDFVRSEAILKQEKNKTNQNIYLQDV
jgi:hypothetical protein